VTRYSPFHRNVFLTASTDASIRLYDQLNPRPFHVLEPSSSPILAAAWSPSRPLVIAAGAGDGTLFIYDLKRSRAKPEVTLKVTTDKSAVTALAFNPQSPELLATADAQGHVKIWRLSTALSKMSERELPALRRMVTAAQARGVDDVEEAEEGYGDDNYEEDDE